VDAGKWNVVQLAHLPSTNNVRVNGRKLVAAAGVAVAAVAVLLVLLVLLLCMLPGLLNVHQNLCGLF